MITELCEHPPAYSTNAVIISIEKMKARKLLLANAARHHHMAYLVVSFPRLLTLFVMSAFVMQQEFTSSYTNVVAKSFLNDGQITRSIRSTSSQYQSSYTQTTGRPVMEQQPRDNIINYDQTTAMQSSSSSSLSQTTASSINSQPEVAAITWPNTSHLKPPVIVSKPEETVVTPGSNVTLACEAQGSQPLTFVWFQNEKNLTKSDAPSTKLLEEKRYEIFQEITASNTTTSYLFLMNLRLTDTSLFLCWVENPAGYTFENYSLVVNDSLALGQAHTLTTNLFQTAPAYATGYIYPPVPVIIAGLVILSLAAIIFIGLQIHQCRQEQQDKRIVSKKSAGKQLNEFNKSTIHHHEKSYSNSSNNGGKYTPSTVDSAEDEEDDNDIDDLSQTSSCNKNNLRVLAVNDLDGFIEQMRSGIINMEYHSMSPVIQFNKSNKNNQAHQVSQSSLAGGGVASNAQVLRTQSSLLADHHLQQQQQQQQAFQSQQQLYQPAVQQQFQAATQAAPNYMAQAYVPPAHPFPLQQTPMPYNQATQPFKQQQQPYQHDQSQSAQPQRPQSYHQLAYMNQFPSSSSSHSSQTPFTNSYQNGNGYYY